MHFQCFHSVVAKLLPVANNRTNRNEKEKAQNLLVMGLLPGGDKGSRTRIRVYHTSPSIAKPLLAWQSE